MADAFAGDFYSLSRRFKAHEVAKNPKGFHYVSIDATIKRFNQVLGTAWTFYVKDVDLLLLPTEEITYGKAEKPGFLAKVVAEIKTLDSIRGGTGADYADDPDKAIKTAQAEAFKKAGHQYGVGLYLWDARERALVDLVNAVTGGVVSPDWVSDAYASTASVTGLKSAVQTLAAIEGATLTAEGIASHFELESVQALQDTGTLVTLLENGGLL